jgi:hypothetical protein
MPPEEETVGKSINEQFLLEEASELFGLDKKEKEFLKKFLHLTAVNNKIPDTLLEDNVRRTDTALLHSDVNQKYLQLKDELTAVLMRHKVASEEKCEALVDDLCAKIELPALRLPDEAPMKYEDRKEGHNIIDFLLDPDGWGKYVKAGLLTRVELGRRDRTAYNALARWLKSNELPDGVSIPKKSEVTDQLVRQHPNPSERPAHLMWTERSRRRRANAAPT